MLCPVCKNVDLVMTERQGIEIDYCPNCRGVWLDRGELDKIIERTLGAGVMGIAADGRGPDDAMRREGLRYGRGGHHDGHRHHDQEYGHPGRQRSFWKDLFD